MPALLPFPRPVPPPRFPGIWRVLERQISGVFTWQFRAGISDPPACGKDPGSALLAPARGAVRGNGEGLGWRAFGSSRVFTSRCPEGITSDMLEMKAKSFFVYMTASRPHGVIYVGMTSDLPGRALQHRDRVIEGFTKRYWVGRLVYFEAHDNGSEAARREWLMKRWRRAWKIELIETQNPSWADLYDEAARLHGFEP